MNKLKLQYAPGQVVMAETKYTQGQIVKAKTILKNPAGFMWVLMHQHPKNDLLWYVLIVDTKTQYTGKLDRLHKGYMIRPSAWTWLHEDDIEEAIETTLDSGTINKMLRNGSIPIALSHCQDTQDTEDDTEGIQDTSDTEDNENLPEDYKAYIGFTKSWELVFTNILHRGISETDPDSKLRRILDDELNLTLEKNLCEKHRKILPFLDLHLLRDSKYIIYVGDYEVVSHLSLMIEPPQTLSPMKFKEYIRKIDYDIYTNNIDLIRWHKPENVIVCLMHDGKPYHKRLNEHPRYEKFENELDSAELFSLFGNSWLKD